MPRKQEMPVQSYCLNFRATKPKQRSDEKPYGPTIERRTEYTGEREGEHYASRKVDPSTICDRLLSLTFTGIYAETGDPIPT